MGKHESVIWPEDEQTNIQPVEIVNEVRDSFLQYSMSVIVSRALPDVRDGLKPVHRRILYTMYENGLTPDKAYRKCADTVGAVLGRYHPHGDASVYDAMVRMAQDFSLRYPMVDGHGNFGNVDGYPAAAYRYTESKMSKLAVHMLDDIEKETVPWMPNYDDRMKEPVVLPARFPSLLVNGSDGIAVGMATKIPPHNLAEVIDGMCYLIDHPDASLGEICEYIKGPDFPTGGIIMGRSGIRAAYATGRGKIILRGKTEISELPGGKSRIIITSLPYQVNKKALVKNIYDLSAEKRIEGIDDVVDYSSKRDGGIRIYVDVKKDVNPNIVLNKLFSYTQLQSSFGVIMLALVDNQPKILTLIEMLQNYIDFQCQIIENRTRFDMRKAQERAHILEGLKTALDFIDEVIQIIRSSATVTEAKENLTKRFGLDDIQTTAIVQMQLGKLANLEKQKILDELKEKLAFIQECMAILGDHHRILEIVKDEALNLRDKFCDDRRTEITDVAGEVDIEDLIPKEECVITKTVGGYIKRLAADTYEVQHKGGRGITGVKAGENDVVENMMTCSSHDNIMLFTNLGRVYKMKAYEIPESSRTARGMNVINLIPLQSGEKLSRVLSVADADEESYICMITKKGTMKRSRISDFKNIRKNGIIAISLNEGDELSFVQLTHGQDELYVATKKGKGIRFEESQVRPMGRTAAGVRAIRLAENDEVVAMDLCLPDTVLLTVTETGLGRKSKISDYRLQSRGGRGTINYKTELYGDVAAVVATKEDEDVIMISSDGIIIRMPVSEISTYSRPAKGVIVMRIAEGSRVLSVATAEHDDEEVTAHPEEGNSEAGAVSAEDLREEEEETADETNQNQE